MAIRQPVTVQPRPNVRQINYLSKTFADFRQNLIEYSKAYFPNTYADFNEASPGMMFIEMASYLGDVLSFYIDNQFKENLLAYADDRDNVITIAQFLGYRPRTVASATTSVEFTIIVPSALNADGVYVPNDKFLPTIGRGSVLSTSDGRVRFVTTEDTNFRDIDPVDYVATNFTVGGEPTEFLVTKKATVLAGTLKTATFSFGSPQKFTTVSLPDEPIVAIDSVVDSDGLEWSEVSYLAQDVIMDEVDVAVGADPQSVSKMRLRKVPRRFVTRTTKNGRLQLMFGSGDSNAAEQDVIVDSRQIATSQYGTFIQDTIGNIALDNFNFLNSSAFGLAPANTTLTVTYLAGGGVETNTPSNTITVVDDLKVLNDISAYSPSDRSAFTATLQRLLVTNPAPAVGGGDVEDIESIRENALSFFNAQNRVVTANDYVTRTYALPSKYGRVSKAYAIRDEQLNSVMQFTGDGFVENPVRPTAVNLYALGYDRSGKLTQLNDSIKHNLATYLGQYRMMTDEVTILDAFIVNIGVRFHVVVFRNYNLNDVIARCISAVESFFSIDKWTINQPIVLADLIYTIGAVDGVQTVTSLQVFNKYRFKDGEEYQPYRYDIEKATVSGVIYPSLDPSIFEIKFPETDIIGSATQ